MHGKLEGKARTEDDSGYLRGRAGSTASCLLVERPNEDFFALTMLRQFLIRGFYAPLLAGSACEALMMWCAVWRARPEKGNGLSYSPSAGEMADPHGRWHRGKRCAHARMLVDALHKHLCGRVVRQLRKWRQQACRPQASCRCAAIVRAACGNKTLWPRYFRRRCWSSHKPRLRVGGGRQGNPITRHWAILPGPRCRCVLIAPIPEHACGN